MGVSRIGLLGGSFDPIHCAHIALAHAAHEALALAEVQLLPAGEPWQRAPLHASPAHRLAMAALATQDQPGLSVNAIEVNRHGPTYTVDTVMALPRAQAYVWIMGADQLANFCSWRAWETIVDRVDLAVAARPGTPLNVPQPLSDLMLTLGRTITQVPFTPTPVSGTEIRSRLAVGDPVDDWLDPKVVAYIRQHGLYGASASV